MNNLVTYQFELWEECNSNCDFCYLGDNVKRISSSQKIENINRTIDTIQSEHFLNGIDCLGYIGGEFFQGQLSDNNVKQKFLELMTINATLLNNKNIKQIWISASLLYGNQNDLFDVLKIFQNNYDKIWILTSYDVKGRFHTQNIKNNWIHNIKKIKDIFPEININITSIVTGDFIDQYLNDTLDLYDIIKKFNCSLFLKPTAKINKIDDKCIINSKIPNFFPTRDKMMKFLIKYIQKESIFSYDKLFNINYRADYLKLYGDRQQFSHRIKNKYNEETVSKDDTVSNELLKCGHSVQYQSYIDSDKCLICDKQKIRDLYIN